MKKYRDLFFYIIIIGVFSILIFWIAQAGSALEEGREIINNVSDQSKWELFLESIKHNIGEPLAILMAQIITIIIVARFFGWICKKIGQPTVVGEIIAGIALGPSLLGLYFPEFSGMLFPISSLDNLNFLSQIGLILFMFIVGMELDLNVLKNKAQDAVVVSHASIVIPFAMGMGLSYFIYPQFAPESISFLSFSLFIGISMSITAFPVLARIVQERGIHKTRLGSIVITCAAADDITAWCLLAAVIAIVKAGSFLSALYTIALAVTYVILMIKLVRPFLRRIGDLYNSKANLSKSYVAIFFLTLFISAYTTEVIGIHALFGAFMAGAIMPENPKFRSVFIEKVEDIALVLLLPLFFVYTGLRTEIGLINSVSLWKMTGVIILVATIGKFAGSAFAARIVGQSWKNSLSIGVLMNTRGLMELVVLNIGYDLGVLDAEIFAMLVIMALVTTFMTGPGLNLINKIFKKDISEVISIIKQKILISFANPKTGVAMYKIANSLTGGKKESSAITALHLTTTTKASRTDEYETQSFNPILDEAERLDQPVSTIFKVSNSIETDIIDITNEGDYDLLILGSGQSIYEGSMLGRILGFTTRFINPTNLINQVTGKDKSLAKPFGQRINDIILRANASVGVLVDKDLDEINRVFVPIEIEGDLFLLKYARKLIDNVNAHVTILNDEAGVRANPNLLEAIDALQKDYPEKVSLVELCENCDEDDEFIKRFDLMLLSAGGWIKLLDQKNPWLEGPTSYFIVTNYPKEWDNN